MVSRVANAWVGQTVSAAIPTFLDIRDRYLRQRLSDLGYQSIPHLFVQARAHLAQGLGVGNKDKGHKVSAVGAAIKLLCQLLGERSLVRFLNG